MKCVVETTPPTHHGRALAPGPPPRRAHLSLPSSAPSGHTTARLKADILVSDSEPRPAKSPRSAPLRRVRQAKPRFATQTGSKPNARPATHSLRVLPQRRESAQFNSYISEDTTRWWWCGCQKQPRQPPACCAASCNLRAFIRALGINTNRRRYTDCSAPQPHGPHHPQRPPPGLAALARPPFRRVGLEFSWKVPGIQLESNWNLTSFQMNARSQRRLGGYGGGEEGGIVRRG